MIPEFYNPDLLATALTHKSYANEHSTKEAPVQNNERLEFLGDAVVNYIAAEWLYQQYPTLGEGRLTSLRAALIRSAALAQFAQTIGLPSELRLGKGEEESGGRQRANILCDAFEAVLAALYLDQGMAAAQEFFVPLLNATAHTLLSENLDRDAKTVLQEWSQSVLNVTPRYQLFGTEGPDHAKKFKVEVWLGELMAATGQGHSKQIAEQMAAREALKLQESLVSSMAVVSSQ
ncbi:MAG: ribonuclease III [Anaerolineae bacterium]|nr:ribonuclease III [Anaerolineae bacterium]